MAGKGKLTRVHGRRTSKGEKQRRGQPHPHVHHQPQLLESRRKPYVQNLKKQQNPSDDQAQHQDFQQLLALPVREHLTILSQHRIPGKETLWFGRDKEQLSRVIVEIFQSKFDGPYFSWEVTPIKIQERYFRTFARKYNWDNGITELVKDGFLKIAKKQMKKIASQAKKSGQKPEWIRDTLWREMSVHWNTLDDMERSSNESQSQNFDNGGLGVHKHFGETYEKNMEKRMSQIDDDDAESSATSTQQSTHRTLRTRRTLTIEEQNEIFLKSVDIDEKGNYFAIGSQVETLNKGKRKANYASDDSSSILKHHHDQLRRNMAELDAEKARLDEQQRLFKSQIARLEMVFAYMKETYPEFAAFVATQQTRQATTTSNIEPANATTATPLTAPGTTLEATPVIASANAPLSNKSSSTSPAS
ncbi:uncharacterized protein LOC111832615 [Capsella rubella]|uniref:uncharacterized protein LOC111832615 n=1 Tax=Capsella rubella TaxID=81985 RepID=UPI000CD4DDD9|nr:uncharacterized protein LOC111832615 [Capsella rubella]